MNKAILTFLFLFTALALSATAGDDWTINAQSGLTLRSGPDRNASMVAVLPNGTKVTEIERSAHPVTIDGITAVWVRVSYGSINGWLFSGYLESNQTQPAEYFFSTLRKCLSAGTAVELSGGLNFSGLTYSEYRVIIKLEADGTFVRDYCSRQGSNTLNGTYQIRDSSLILVYKNMSRATERYIYARNEAGKEGLVQQGQTALNEPKLTWIIR